MQQENVQKTKRNEEGSLLPLSLGWVLTAEGD